MPNIATALREEITRLARKEVRAQTQKLQRASTQYRKDIALMKRQAVTLKAQLDSMERRARGSAPVAGAEPQASGARFSAKGLRSSRKSLGLSAADYGVLAGVSGVSIYKWERGNTRPRQAQIGKLVSVRGLTKTVALARLVQLRSKKAPKGKKKK